MISTFSTSAEFTGELILLGLKAYKEKQVAKAGKKRLIK